jgi:hypothetical protein
LASRSFYLEIDALSEARFETSGIGSDAMEENTLCRGNSPLEDSQIWEIHEKHRAACAFLRTRCEEGSLTPVQKATILGLIDQLVEEEKILEWAMGLAEPAIVD